MSRLIDAIFRLTDNFSAPMSKTIKAMVSAGAEGNRMRKSIEKAGKSITAVGASLTASVTVPVVGVATACGKMALSFEDGIAKVSTIADTSVMSLDKIKEGTLGLSNQLGASVTKISEAQYNAISAGVKTEKSLGMVSTAIKAAKAGFTDAATAVDGLTTVYNSFQGAVDYQAIADQMLLTQNYGKTTFGEMASSIGMVTPVANALNVSTEELFSSIAILTKNGINTSSSITGLKAAYSNILKPTADASKMAKQLGIDFSATHLKAVGWAQFIAEIKEKTEGNSDAMAKLFGSVEALNSMTVLAGAGLEDFNTCLGKMADSAGLTQESYEKLLTPSARWEIALNKIKNAGITIGEKLLPIFERVTGIVDQAAERFNGLSDSQVDLIIKIAGIAAAVGPLVMVFGKMVTGSAKLLGVIANVNKITGSFKLLKFAFAALTSPAAIVIGVLAVLAGIAAAVVLNFDEFKTSLKQYAPIFSEVRSGFQQIYERIKPLIGMARQAGAAFRQVLGTAIVKAAAAIVGAFGMIAKAAIPVINGILGVIESVNFDAIGQSFSGLGTHFQQLYQQVMPIVQKISQLLKVVFQVELATIFGGAIGFITGFATQLSTIIGGLITIFDGLITFMTGIFTGNWQMAWDGVKSIVSGTVEAVVGLVKGMANGVIGAINGIVRAVNGLGVTVPDWVPGIGGKSISFNIPEIPMLARGTDYWKGGLAQIHERGGEIIDLPRGSRVYPHDESIEKARREGRSSFVLEKLADQIIVREEADIDRIVQELLRNLRKAGMNMGGVY